ncbi:hypothetical protein H4219_004585 [Mycoemilia scoparia]|uniref:Uncharacterized protein n=1 Tax=Mycoemilia scoparia TaxID=417184 RepID=A0A9W7ZR63_9FUNG|nr:hypothetical protein H4219_004585 [Mycoemilia scoparia]
MDLKPPPSSFAYLDKRRCGEALSMLLESIQYLLNNTTFNEHGIEKETPDNLKAVLREHMLIKLRSFEAVYSKYEQDKVTVLYLQRTFVDFHEKYVLPFVEKNFGSYKDKIHAVRQV